MKPVKLALITTLLAFSLALASAVADAGAPPQQPAGEGKNQSSPSDQTTDEDAGKYEEAYNKGDTKTLAGFYSEAVDSGREGNSRLRYRDAGKWRGDDDAVHPCQGQERRSLGDFPNERKGGTAFERLLETRGS